MMDSTTIAITYHPDLPEEKNVHFIVVDSIGRPLLQNFTMEEISQLDDERLHGVISGLIAIKALFEEAIHLRNEQQVKIAKEMEQLIGEPVVVRNIPIDTPSRKVTKFNEENL
jgi:hypothetical protein